MEKELYILFHTSNAILDIEKELERRHVHARCFRQSTIKRSNFIYTREIERAKALVLENINSMYKPHIVYHINKYYHFK